MKTLTLACSLIMASVTINAYSETIEVIGVVKQMARFNYFSAYKANGSTPDCSINYVANSENKKRKAVFDNLMTKKDSDDYICTTGSGYVCLAKVNVDKEHFITKIFSVKQIKTKEKTLCDDFELQPI